MASAFRALRLSAPICLALVISVLFPPLLRAAQPEAERSSVKQSVSESAVKRRAIEAVIWGMPAVNYDLMLQEMLRKTSAKVGEVIYWGRPLDWRNQTLTPNPDTVYFMTFFDTKKGPIVLDLPPAGEDGSFNGNIVNVWQMPLEDAGLLGADKVQAANICSSRPGIRARRPTAISRCSRTHTAATR